MRALLAIPLYGILLLLYNAMILATSADNFLPDVVVANLKIPSSGAEIVLTWNIVFVLAGIGILFVEILKSTRSTDQALLDHILSLGVFVVFLIELLVWQAMGTATFLILTFLALVDVVAGFTVSLVSARRDISIGG